VVEAAREDEEGKEKLISGKLSYRDHGVWILGGGGGGVKKSPYLENRGAEAVEAVGQPVQRFQGVFTIVASVVRCSVPQIKKLNNLSFPKIQCKVGF
jgi:hypothetical protein